MNQNTILNKVKEYAKEHNISTFNIYRPMTENIIEYTDEITLKNLSSVLIGGTFLRKEKLIISILPFVKFEVSEHFLAIVSTYRKYLEENQNVMINLLANNKELIENFSKTNKELYCYSQFILGEENVKKLDYFNNVINTKNNLIERKASFSFAIDLNEIINKMNIKSFNWIERSLVSLLEDVEYNKDVLKSLEIDYFNFNKSRSTIIYLNFIGSEKESLIQSFVEKLVDNYITVENSKIKVNDYKNEQKKIINLTLLEIETENNVNKKNKKSIKI